LSSSGKKKVLCIWGQGGGYGHAARLLSIADALGKDGHAVHLALRDRQAVQAITGGYRGTISDCPVYRPAMQLGRHQASLADLLLLSGFADTKVLASLLEAWRSLVSLCSPDLIIVDHAPAALLAAYELDIPVFITGNPFVVPVPGQPLADWRPEAPADKLVSRTEALVLRNINGLPCLSDRPLARMSDLFSCPRTILTCYPVLDACRDQRKATDYCAANLLNRGDKTGTKPFEIVCYLKPAYPGLQQLADALAASGRSVLMLVPGLGEDHCRQLGSGRLVATSRFSDLEHALDGASLFIGHGNLNSLNQCLRKAIPMLLLPLQLENLNHALQLQQAGLAKVTHALESSREYAAMIAAAMKDQDLALSLRQHAEDHHDIGMRSAAGVFRTLVATL
jgi:hypothetical protein